MLVLLFLAFGSVVLPLKAIVMNVLSIGASFGVVVWIFQDGHLAGLLGFTSDRVPRPTQPILMLAILFGLSMDYEVFLLVAGPRGVGPHRRQHRGGRRRPAAHRPDHHQPPRCC